MDTLYGEVTKEQFNDYRTKLHKKLFWLLLYKDPDTCSDFDYVDFPLGQNKQIESGKRSWNWKR